MSTSYTVETPDGVKLHARVFTPPNQETTATTAAAGGGGGKDNLVIVLVHPYSVLGGCQGLLRGIAVGLAERGYRAVTFDMRGAGRSTGRASLTGSSEILDVVSVCQWISHNLNTHRILLVGSSAVHDDQLPSHSSKAGFHPEDPPVPGAPISGSAVDQVEEVVGYVSLGYPFGWTASILFGRHHKAILSSPKPKLFVMGTKDGFTSVKQLENKLKSAAGRVETHLIEGTGHFQMEGPAYDAQMVELIHHFIASL